MNRLIRLVLEYLRSRQSRRKLRIVGELLREVGPDLHRYIRSRYFGENNDDIFQETLWAIADGLEDFEGKTDKAFMNWCLGIARHKVVDELRARRRDRTVSLTDDEVWRAVEALSAYDPISVQDRLDLEFAMRLVAAAKAPCLDFLQSRYIEGLDYETIGSEHGISERAAWLAVHRCVQFARKLLGE